MPEEQVTTEPWQELQKVIDSRNVDHLEAFLQLLPPGDTAYTISRLPEEYRTRMLSFIRPSFAADLMEYLSDEHAADLLEDLPVDKAAAIVDELPSDDQADVLIELDEADQQAIIEQMSPEEAADARQLVQYEHDTAGGLMITECLAYDQDTSIDDVIADLHANAEKYAEYDVQYVYVVDKDEKLLGLVTVRSLLLTPGDRSLTSFMIRDPVSVSHSTSLDELEDVFDQFDFNGVPTLDEQGRLIGVVERSALEEALGERAEDALLRVGGIVGGEELRTMPTLERCQRRLTFLAPNLVLLLMSAWVIAKYEHTIEQVAILAAFLPVVAGLCGGGGNQAVAVSMRELSRGLVKPGDVYRVLFKEAAVGLLSGLVLGAALFFIVWLWTDDPWKGAVVGGAMPLVVVVATCFGGAIPLVMQRFNIDPAMAAGPIVTTVVDFISFFVVLAFATLALL